MGLDITAYRTVRRLTDAERAALPLDRPENWEAWHETFPDATVVRPFFSDFPTTADWLAQTDWYVCVEPAFSFRAGSYSVYNDWRARLARLVGLTPDKAWLNPQPGPFIELINNSDCEGVIGPQTSAKLAHDFDTWRDHAARNAANGFSEWLRSYEDWSSAFHLAAHQGCVVFH